ncbi:NADH dehydrogenase [ubiquinone] 1 alpha subcomplex assembly factor 2 [Calliopsis andreniformis]|uniref:NADH dehydrogenase [ubiquinone] 1 alpha subcomplex assembly factor 2 n=1 Tax=Calliopsis andreniformis TaxID=337506 RepID=UPI003FCD3E7B
MSGKQRGVFQLIWKHFVASVTPSFKQHKLIGEDFFGTKYYEIPVAKTFMKKRPSRYFVPVNKNDFEQELPAEWEAWLRYRRINPPTNEEVEMNYRIAMNKKQNAAKLEATYSSKKVDMPQLLPERKGQQSFPTYEEYKNDGIDYKIKRP